MLHCGEPETEVGAKFHMHQAGQRSLNEYEAKAGSWGLEADFFFALLPSKISWWNCCTNMLMSRRQGFNVLKFEATYLYHVWNSRSRPPVVNILLQHNSIAYVEWSAQLDQIAKTRQKIRSVKLTEFILVTATFDKFSIIKSVQWPETEIKWIC